MAFKNLQERFESNINELYKGSAKVDRSGATHLHPILEVKPNDTHPKYGEDTRTAPVASVIADATRMTRWSKDPIGLLWYGQQAVLQTGNMFSETRFLNPLFVIGNTQPYVHIPRSLSSASEKSLVGDISLKSAASSPKIGSAGRLQLSTSKIVIGSVMGRSQNNLYETIIRHIPPFKVIQAVGAMLSATESGILGVNQRPELDISGTKKYDDYYSVNLWKAQQNLMSANDPMQQIGDGLRSGNIKLANNSLGKTIGNIVSNVIKIGISSLFGKRNLPLSNIPNSETSLKSAQSSPSSVMNGLRYFITSATDADRYLEGTVDFDGRRAYASLGFMNRQPIQFDNSLLTVSNITNMVSETNLSFYSNNSSLGFLDRLIKKGSNWLNKNLTIQSAQSAGKNLQNTLQNSLRTSSTSIGSENPAEEAMKFSKLSIRQRYIEDNGQAELVRSDLLKQKTKWLESIPTSNMGYGGGIRPGTEINPDYRSKTPVPVENSTGYNRYFFDNMNSANMAVKNIEGNSITKEEIDADREKVAPLIDLYFFDFVNKIAIPFRAYISGLTENISPEFSDIPYIGRIERNIVYTGVKRDLSFTLQVHAFNDEELDTIWRKINHLSGLCFPSTYNSGFMVPPFVKLTLGDIYNNQPGYIRSIQHSVDDDIPWEIEVGRQVPHGINISISYCIIEKHQMSALSRTELNTFQTNTILPLGSTNSIPNIFVQTNTRHTISALPDKPFYEFNGKKTR